MLNDSAIVSPLSTEHPFLNNAMSVDISGITVKMVRENTRQIALVKLAISYYKRKCHLDKSVEKIIIKTVVFANRKSAIDRPPALNNAPVQRQKAVAVHFPSEQLLSFWRCRS